MVPADLDNIIDKVGITFEFLGKFVVDKPIRHILEDKKLLEHTLLLEELCTVFSCLGSIYHEELQALA